MHIERLPAGILLYKLAHQALTGVPWVGSYSVAWHISYLKGAPWVESYPVVRVHQALDGPAYCSAADAGMWGDRGYSDGSTPYL